MPVEAFDVSAGAWATLDAEARADEWDGVSHEAGPMFGFGQDFYVSCSCGRRVDVSDREQVRRLHAAHAEMEREAVERAECAALAPSKLAATRAALRATADQKVGRS